MSILGRFLRKHTPLPDGVSNEILSNRRNAFISARIGLPSRVIWNEVNGNIEYEISTDLDGETVKTVVAGCANEDLIDTLLRGATITKEKIGKKHNLTIPVECPVWTLHDVGVLKAFLNTPTGINFLAKSRSMINALALAGCADMFHTTHSAGVAHGANEMLRCQASWAEIKFQESEPVKPENSATDELNAVDHAAKRAF